MKVLLRGQFLPVTERVGFVEALFDAYVSAHFDWISRGRPMMVTDAFESDLPGALARLEPLNIPKVLLVETQSPWVAVFDPNASPDSAVRYMSKILPCRGVIASCVQDTYNPKTREGRPGAVQFSLSEGPAPTTVDAIKRTISATNQCEQWEWHEHGERLAYEKAERYQARRVRDRFTAEMLDEYCAALGIRLFDEGFYGPRCALILDTQPFPADYELQTYKSVQMLLQIGKVENSL